MFSKKAKSLPFRRLQILKNVRTNQVPISKKTKASSTKPKKPIPEGIEMITPGIEYTPDFLKINEDSQDLFQFASEMDPDKKTRRAAKSAVLKQIFEAWTGRHICCHLKELWNKHLVVVVLYTGMEKAATTFTKPQTTAKLSGKLFQIWEWKNYSHNSLCFGQNT